ncbi:MAG: alpha-mannosidase, partial [Anaerolineae bacterium]|nr:alpha-mannosidase [Anaerolineae bacterium]
MSSYLSQFNRTVQSIQQQAKQNAQHLDRLTAQLQFAHRLCTIHPDQAGEWQALILDAARALDGGLTRPNVDLNALTAQVEAALAPVGQAAKAYTLLCVSHAHIDMNWMWSWPETVAVTNDTFQTMLALMDEFPGFIFSQDQASVYDLIERYNPQMFAQIQKRVQKGRWEITASQWVECDKNMSGGESLSRHLLYTRAYVQDKFGLGPEAVQVDFEPDTFGHPATIPAILTRGGVKYYYHCRGSVGPHLYWWRGPDGSRVLAFNDVQWYMCAISPDIADALPEYAQATGMKAMPVLYGVGDHGGGPTRRDLRRIIEMNEWPV